MWSLVGFRVYRVFDAEYEYVFLKCTLPKYSNKGQRMLSQYIAIHAKAESSRASRRSMPVSIYVQVPVRTERPPTIGVTLPYTTITPMKPQTLNPKP